MVDSTLDIPHVIQDNMTVDTEVSGVLAPSNLNSLRQEISIASKRQVALELISQNVPIPDEYKEVANDLLWVMDNGGVVNYNDETLGRQLGNLLVNRLGVERRDSVRDMIINFQAVLGMYADGIVGPDTATAIYYPGIYNYTIPNYRPPERRDPTY
jgi:hypothetical protein